jgi:hypothetical protein
LLNVKRSHWQFNIMHPYINVAQFLRMAQKVVLITSKCLWKFSSTTNYNQYYGYTTPKLSINHKQGTFLAILEPRQSSTLTTHIHFLVHFNAKQNGHN